MSAELLRSALQAVLTDEGDGRHRPPGAAFAFAEGSLRAESAAGLADIDSGESLTTSHVFDLASVSKTLTILTMRRLFAEGAVRPDDALGALLGARAGAAADVTIEQLLRHRSGLTPWWPLYLLPDATEDPVAAALRLPLRTATDTGRAYSDLGMQALGAVIAATTAQPLERAVRALLLDPLGADTVTPGRPAPSRPTVSGPDGDEIERAMVRDGVPYPVDVDGSAFPWRTRTVRGEIADGNAFHAFGGAAGHAGWFSDVDGLLRIAELIAEPERLDLGRAAASDFAREVDAGQGQGLLTYRIPWLGRERLFLGHSGFTGTFVAAAPADAGDPAVLTVLLTNRLHGRPAPDRAHLVAAEHLWRAAMARTDALVHDTPAGENP